MREADLMEQVDYLAFYDRDSYLFETVHRSFHRDGLLSAFDFFCIVVWKANRAKSKVAANLLARGFLNLDDAVRELTSGIAKQATPQDRLRYLIAYWRLRLPMASAILTVLYPDEFTVYDVRVCSALGDFANLGSVREFGRLWMGYQDFVKSVGKQSPDWLTLREKDRYLWGKSFYEQLVDDIAANFHQAKHGV